MKRKLKSLYTMLVMLWKIDVIYLFSTVAETIVYSVTPFVGLRLTKESISMLTSNGHYKDYVKTVVILLLISFILGVALNELNTFNNVKGNLIGQKLYTKIIETCLYVDYEELQKKEIMDKKEMATKALEGGSLSELIMHFKNILGNIIVIVGIVYVIARADWFIMLISTVIVIVNGALALKLKKVQYDSTVEMIPINRKIGYFVGISAEASVAKEARLYHSQKQFLTRYQALYMETFAILKKVFRLSKRNMQFSNFSNTVLEFAIYIILGFKVLSKKVMDVAEFSTYAAAIRQFKGSMINIMESFGEVEKNGMHLSDYFEFINLPSKFALSKGHVEGTQYEIRFEHVSFQYPGQDRFALKDINLTIHSGEKLSIVGENGSGKTTFIKLLTRLYDPTEGAIYVNGVNIKEIEYEEYLSLFSAVFQDFGIYAFSIKDNITMMQEPVDEDKVNLVLKQVGLYDKVSQCSHGIDTYIYRIYGDDCVEFSGGQNQKLAIARAAYKNSPILILDEPTAALDPRAEFEIFKDFNAMADGRTTVYISHRLSSCVFSDQIAVFRQGELVEVGSHKELIQKDGLYSELFNMQAQYYKE